MELCPKWNVSEMCKQITKNEEFENNGDVDNYAWDIFKLFSRQNVHQEIKEAQVSVSFDNAVDIPKNEIKIKALVKNYKKSLWGRMDLIHQFHFAENYQMVSKIESKVSIFGSKFFNLCIILLLRRY